MESTERVLFSRYSSLLNDLARTDATLSNRQLAIFYGKQAINSVQNERQRLRNFDAVSQRGFITKKEKHYRRLAGWLIEEGRVLEAEQILAMLKEEEILSYLSLDASEAEKLKQRATLRAHEADALKRYNELADNITALGVEFGKLQQLQRKGIKLTGPQEKRYDDLAGQIKHASSGFQIFLRQLGEEFAKRSNAEKDLRENLSLQAELKEWDKSAVFLSHLSAKTDTESSWLPPTRRVTASLKSKRRI